jgi:hypothetical protein
MGDSLDNIPGVPGVGQVTARKWISTYGDLDTLLAKADEIKGKVGESLRQHKEAAVLSRSLAEIPTDLPIPFEPAALQRSEPDAKKLKDLFVELEFHSLAAEIGAEGATAPEIAFGRVEPGAAFAVGPGEPFGAALLTARERVLLAVAGAGSVEIAEETTPEILERWKSLDRPGREIWLADAKPLDTLLARAGRSVAGALRRLPVQYVLSPGVGGSTSS